jgi:hypothetical protein
MKISSAQALGSITKSKPIKWIGNKFQKDAAKALAATTVSSIIIKDGLGCAMYVNQSLNNKKIPEKKRKFVAALDLTNGLLMIGAQIGMFFAMKKFSEPIFNKLFKNSFNGESARNIYSRIRMNMQKLGFTPPRKLALEKEFQKVRKDALDVFKFVADISAATIVGKRVIVPFIATPLAGKVEKRMNKNKEAQVKDANTEGNNSNPTMQGQIHQEDSQAVSVNNMLDKYKQDHLK